MKPRRVVCFRGSWSGLTAPGDTDTLRRQRTPAMPGGGGRAASTSAARIPRSVSSKRMAGRWDATDPLTGTLQVRSDGGRIQLDRIAGPVCCRDGRRRNHARVPGSSVRCTLGRTDVRAESIRGEARLETGGGDITAGEMGGPLQAATGGGRIHVTRAGSTVSVIPRAGAHSKWVRRAAW